LTRIRVLVVDDSAFARKVLRHSLAGSPNIEVVGTAHDGLDALERIAELKPDVVTLDLVMPNLDGIGVLQALKSLGTTPLPRVIVVSMSGVESDLAISALREGALDIVHKPTALANDRLYELSAELRAKVEAAAAARSPGQGPVSATHPAPCRQVAPTPSRLGRNRRVHGRAAGSELLARRTSQGFSGADCGGGAHSGRLQPKLAEHLDRDCRLDVREAKNDEPLRSGHAVIARAGMHLAFKHTSDGYRTVLSSEPRGGLHRPSVDVTFGSAGEVSDVPVLGIVLTGMGNDGLLGARIIRQRGGTLLTQSEESCVVYGMPRVVWEDGIAAARSSIQDLPELLMAHL
jgi:two-component system chemotaxis response regulator CheB